MVKILKRSEGICFTQEEMLNFEYTDSSFILINTIKLTAFGANGGSLVRLIKIFIEVYFINPLSN